MVQEFTADAAKLLKSHLVHEQEEMLGRDQTARTEITRRQKQSVEQRLKFIDGKIK